MSYKKRPKIQNYLDVDPVTTFMRGSVDKFS